MEWYKDYIGPSKDPMEPISDIYYPIFEQAADLVVLPSPNQESFPILGFLALSIYWRDMIKDILPLGMDGIVIVFENPCNPTFTYEIVSYMFFFTRVFKGFWFLPFPLIIKTLFFSILLPHLYLKNNRMVVTYRMWGWVTITIPDLLT